MLELKFLKEIEVYTIPEQIANAIKEAIVEGNLKPGDPIPKQETLSKELGVSRPTVREALRILADAKLIEGEKVRYGGFKVADFDPETATKSFYEMIVLSMTLQSLSAWDLFEVRKMIEIPSAALAAERRSENDLEDLKVCLTSIDTDKQKIQEILDQDLKFHLILSKSTQNPLAKTLMNAVAMAFKKIPLEFTNENKHFIVAELDKIFEALKNKDPDQAKKAMEMHLNHFIEYFKLSN